MTNQPMSVVQLLREWPPGYGGVERVAHELASVWGGAVYSFDVQGQSALVEDPLPVLYSRLRLEHQDPWSFALTAAVSGLVVSAALPKSPSWPFAVSGGAFGVGIGSFGAASSKDHSPLALLFGARPWCQRSFFCALSVHGSMAGAQSFGSNHHLAAAGPRTEALWLCQAKGICAPLLP